MAKDVIAYFEETVVPLIGRKHPEVSTELTIQICGSYGLGIADEFSDLDAVLWLDDPLWRSAGGHVQLTFEHDLPPFSPSGILEEHEHPEICVWPFSWLGARKTFLDGTSDLPWEDVAFEDFFEIQEALVVRDAKGVFHKLKEATSPSRFPERLWKKLLIQRLKKLDDDVVEYRQVVRRKRGTEENIMAAGIQQELLYLGFLVNKQYWPWRTHLLWAFLRLPSAVSEVLPHVQALSRSRHYDEKLAAIEKARQVYHSHVLHEKLLSREILDDLLWAERLGAWSKSDWRSWIVDCQERAKASGCDPSDFWIWSLWGWK